MPMTTRLRTEGDFIQLRAIFLKWSRSRSRWSVMVGLFLIVLGPKFIGWWIDPSFEGPAGQVLQILMVSSLLFLPVRGVALPVLLGLGRPRVPTLVFLATGLLNLLLSIALAGRLGLVGWPSAPPFQMYCSQESSSSLLAANWNFPVPV
jgi:O-antigen/teichoic acid export membrane protein